MPPSNTPPLLRFAVTSPYRPKVRLLVYAHGETEATNLAREKNLQLRTAGRVLARAA